MSDSDMDGEGEVTGEEIDGFDVEAGPGELDGAPGPGGEMRRTSKTGPTRVRLGGGGGGAAAGARPPSPAPSPPPPPPYESPADRIDAILASGALPTAVDAESMRAAHYFSMAAHQFITGTFIGALCFMSTAQNSRLSIAFMAPLAPVLVMLVMTVWAGQLRSILSVAGVKTFLKMCWTVYRMYAAPVVAGMTLMTYTSGLSNPDSANIYYTYLWACLFGIGIFLGLYWLTEDA